MSRSKRHRRSEPAARFARMHGSPGQHARLTGLFTAVWPFLVAALCAGYLLRAALPVPPLGRAEAGGLLILLGAAIALLAAWLRRRLSAFSKGARGEEIVARELAFLPAEFEVFHGVAFPDNSTNMGSGDFDHVVLGPAGVFVVETKNWSGRVTVDDGHIRYDGKEPDRDPLEQVRQAASSLRRFLESRTNTKVDATPIVCFACDTLDGRTRGISGVMVCNRRSLCAVVEDSMERPLESHLAEKIRSSLQELCG